MKRHVKLTLIKIVTTIGFIKPMICYANWYEMTDEEREEYEEHRQLLNDLDDLDEWEEEYEKKKANGEIPEDIGPVKGCLICLLFVFAFYEFTRLLAILSVIF